MGISYTPEIAAEFLQRLESGETKEDICRSEHMPSSRAISDWTIAGKVKSVPEQFAADFARAREIGEDAIANRLRAVASGGVGSSGDVQRDKLIIYTDLKLLAVWNPKRYGERQILQGDSTADPIGMKHYNADDDALLDAYVESRKKS